MNEHVEFTAGDCAYLAALVDANSRIHVDKRKQRNGRLGYVLAIDFPGLPAETISWMRSKLPGACVVRNTPRYVTSKACALLVRAFSFLQSKTKIAQCKLAFKLNEIRPSLGRGWTDTEVELRAHLADQIQKASRPPVKIRKIPLRLPEIAVSRVVGG